MTIFKSTDGTVVRVTGKQGENMPREGSFVEVQILGGELMFTAGQANGARQVAESPTNVQLTREGALKLAAEILNLVDITDGRKDPADLGSLLNEIFNANYRAFAEVDTAHEKWVSEGR